MTCMGHEGIVAIINSCNANDVVEFSYNGLQIKFRGHKENVGLSNEFPTSNQPDSGANIESPSPVDKSILDDVRLSQLMIDDPFGFEAEILQAESKGVMNETV